MTSRGTPAALLAAAAALGAAGDASAAEPLLTVGAEPVAASPTQATYELLVANHGDAPAQGVALSAAVPEHATLTGADPAATAPCVAGAPAGTACSWELGEVPAGASRTVVVTYALEQAADSYEVDVSASVTATNGDGDSNTDSSLRRGVFPLSDDTFVAPADAADVNHGACDELRATGAGVTAYVDADAAKQAFTNAGEDVRVWTADLLARVKSTSSGATLAAHPLETGEWAQGSGSCAGAAGSGTEPRAGHAPTTADDATATESVPAAGQSIGFDVAADLDTHAELVAMSGWALRAGGADAVILHATEATAAADRPSLLAVYTTKPQAAVCVDVTPEDPSLPSDQVSPLVAQVTDTASKLSNDGGEGCSGSPLPGREIWWELRDDAPDAWFSALDGVARPFEFGSGNSAGPNRVATMTDDAGRTTVDLRLGEPYGGAESAGAGRVDVNPRDFGAKDPEDSDCSPADTCPGENAFEDDVRPAWTAAEPPPPDDGDGGDGTGGGGGAGGAGGPGGASGPGVAPPPGTEGPATRGVLLRASRPRARAGRTVTLAGRVTSSASPCTGPREYVEIHRRRDGRTTFAPFATVSTAADGTFELPLRIDVGAEYVAVAPERPGCAGASSAGVRVLVRPRIVVRAKRRPGRGFRITGRVIPGAPGTATLQRRSRRGRWVAQRRTRTTSTGRFTFTVARLPRVWRVRWTPAAAGDLGAAATRRR
jgi:uncharacterized protein DUF11